MPPSVPVPRVAAVIPARNEQDRIAATVRAVATIGPIDVIVVVDDGSHDGTAELARQAGAIVLSHRRSRGKAAALETGAQAVAAIDVREERELPRHLLFLDADLGETADQTAELVAPVLDGKADMSIATLPAQTGAGGHGFVVRLATNGIVRATGWRPTQPLCGQRCLTRSAYAAAVPLAYGFGIETGLTIDLLRKGFQVVEVPVEFRHRATGNDWRGQLHRGRQWLHVAGALLRRRVLPRP